MEGSSKGLTKGAWTVEEDSLLKQCIHDKYGEGKWHQVPLRAGLNRCRKSCRLRWLNYLNPSIKRGKLGSDEVDLLLRLHKLLGNRWSLIAGRLPGRTANDVKNYWNTNLRKKNESCNKKRKITSSITTHAQKIDVLKPQPRSFSGNFNALSEFQFIPPCPELNNTNVFENSVLTCNEDLLVNNLMDEDNLWLENLLEASQETEAVETENSQTLGFDVEQLWNLFDGDKLD